MLYVGMCLAPKKKIFFHVRNMERLSTLKVSFGALDVDAVPAAKTVLFHCSMVFLNSMECILLIQQRHHFALKIINYPCFQWLRK
jgi:hypothetical protein